MPAIKNYTAPLSGSAIDGGRRATGADAGGLEAAALETLGKAGVDLGQKLLAQKEAEDGRNAVVGIAQLNAKYAKAQQDAATNGADLDQLQQKYEDELTTLRGQATTRHGLQTFDYHEATALQGFQARSAQVQAQRAAAQAEWSVREASRSLGEQVFNDPSSLPAVEPAVNALIANFPPGFPAHLKPKAKQEMMEGLTLQAVRGAILINPEKAEADLKAGKWSLPPEKLAQEVDRAESQKLARESHKFTLLQRAQWERVQESDQTANVYVQDIFKNKFNPEEANANPKLTKDDRQALITFNQRWWDSVNGEGRHSDPMILKDLILRAYAPEDAPNKLRTTGPLLEAVNKGSLSVRDFRILNQVVAEQRDPNNSTIGAAFYRMQNTVNSALQSDIRYSIDKGGRIKAAQVWGLWYAASAQRMNEYREKNKSLSTLFDPASPDYLMNPNFMASFEARVNQNVQVLTSQEAIDAAARRTPGQAVIYIDAQGNMRRTVPISSQVPD